MNSILHTRKQLKGIYIFYIYVCIIDDIKISYIQTDMPTKFTIID